MFRPNNLAALSFLWSFKKGGRPATISAPAAIGAEAGVRDLFRQETADTVMHPIRKIVEPEARYLADVLNGNTRSREECSRTTNLSSDGVKFFELGEIVQTRIFRLRSKLSFERVRQIAEPTFDPELNLHRAKNTLALKECVWKLG